MTKLPLPGPRLAFSLLAAALLQACTTVGPDYQRPEVALPAAWHAPVMAPGEAAEVADTRWWRAFGDPALDALIDDALVNNKDLLIAAHRMAQFAARVDVARAAELPQVGFDAGRSRTWRSQEQPALLATGREPDYNNYEVRASVAWELDVWGRIARATEAARADLLASEESRRAVMLKVVSDVATAYIDLIAADEQLLIARELVKNRGEALALVEVRAAGGAATEIDVARARTSMQQAQTAIPELERRVAAGENALAYLSGREPGPLARGRLELLRIPQVPQGLPSDLLTRRPDVLAAEQALVAANARIGLAKAQYFPTISLTGALGLVSDQLRWLGARTARAGNLGAGLAGVLFDGGRIDGDVRAAEAVRLELAETYLKSVRTALIEVEDSLDARASSNDLVARQVQYVSALEGMARLVHVRHDGGRATLIDVLDANGQAIAARDRLVQGWRDQRVALVSIYKSMGGGWALDGSPTGAPEMPARSTSRPAPEAAADARPTARAVARENLQ